MTRRIADIVVPQPGWERIAGALKTHARDVLGVYVPTTGVPLYTDARHYVARGIPVVLYGAGAAHAARSERPQCRREPAALGLARRDHDRGAGAR